MKRISLSVVLLLSSSLVSLAPLGAWVLPAGAQDFGSVNVGSALAFPRSSERFFDAGRQQFEQEVQRLQNSDRQTANVLDIDPSILQQQQNLQPSEQQFWDEVPSQNPLPIEPLSK